MPTHKSRYQWLRMKAGLWEAIGRHRKYTDTWEYDHVPGG